MNKGWRDGRTVHHHLTGLDPVARACTPGSLLTGQRVMGCSLFQTVLFKSLGNGEDCYKGTSGKVDFGDPGTRAGHFEGQGRIRKNEWKFQAVGKYSPRYRKNHGFVA